MTTTERDSTMEACDCSEDYGPEPGTYVASPEPVMMCANCLLPLAEHVDGRCLDSLGEPAGTYRFLPLGRFAGHVVRDVSDSWGEHLYVLSLGGGFDPPCYTVRGEGFQDAWEWFVDYCATRDLLDDLTEYLSADERAAWERGEMPDGLEMVDGHAGLFDVSAIEGWQIR